MLGTTPFEKRRNSREPYNEHGLLYVEGKPIMLLLRDVCDRGIGAYSHTQFARGERGRLSAKLPRDYKSRSY